MILEDEEVFLEFNEFYKENYFSEKQFIRFGIQGTNKNYKVTWENLCEQNIEN